MSNDVMPKEQPDKTGKVRLNISITPALSQTLEDLALQENNTKSDILRKAIALFEVVHEARKEGGQILIVDPKSGDKKEIIGI
jgi:hypothetical protein